MCVCVCVRERDSRHLVVMFKPNERDDSLWLSNTNNNDGGHMYTLDSSITFTFRAAVAWQISISIEFLLVSTSFSNKFAGYSENMFYFWLCKSFFSLFNGK